MHHKALSVPASATAVLLSLCAAEEMPAIPDIASALLDAAAQSEDPAEVAAVAKAVKSVFPDYADGIDAAANLHLATLEPVEPAPAEAPEEAAREAQQGGVLSVKAWDGKVSASAVMSSGNSENAAVGVALDAARDAGDLTHNFKAYFDYGESNNVTNQKRWGAAYKLDYNFSDNTYAYARLAFDEDDFSGFDYRLFGGAGLGHYFAKSDPFSWKVEGGPGYRYSPIDDTREIEQEVAFYAASETDWLIREGLKFEQDFNVTWTSPTTTFQSVTALTAQLWGDISTGLSLEYRHETHPPLGRDKTDTIAKASLIYGF